MVCEATVPFWLIGRVSEPDVFIWSAMTFLRLGLRMSEKMPAAKSSSKAAKLGFESKSVSATDVRHSRRGPSCTEEGL